MNEHEHQRHLNALMAAFNKSIDAVRQDGFVVDIVFDSKTTGKSQSSVTIRKRIKVKPKLTLVK